MSALEIYEACRCDSCRVQKKFPVKTFLAAGLVLVCSICVVFAESRRTLPLNAINSIKTHIEPIDTKLTAPNTDGWLPPEKLRELNAYE